MGELKFFYPRQELKAELARHAFFTRRAKVPVPTQVEIESISPVRDLMTVYPHTHESGALYTPYVDSEGCFYYVSTTTLEPSERPYSLFLELSRGQLTLLMHKLADWFMLGFRPSQKLKTTLKHAAKRFAKLASYDYDAPDFDGECVKFFNKMTEFNRRVNELLLSQILTSRRNQSEPWSTKFGFSARPDTNWVEPYDSVFAKRRGGLIRPKYDQLFGVYNPDFSWADIEKKQGIYDWSILDSAYAQAEARQLTLTIGPLVRWGERLPAFLKGKTDEQIETLFKQYLCALFEHDAGRTKRWIVAANVESDIAAPPFETRLILAAQTALAIRKLIPGAQAFLGFDQPFGDGALTERQATSPIELAARLARKSVFDGFYLEVNFGESCESTFPRDPMELHRFFDRWCALGAPLCLGLSCPSSPARSKSYDETTKTPRKHGIFKRGQKISDDDLLSESPEVETEVWNEKNQRETIRRFVTAALSRRYVDEILWTRFLDVEPEFCGEATTPRASEVDASDEETALLNEIELNEDDTRKLELDAVRECVHLIKRRSFPTSGLFELSGAPKSTLQKLAATKRAYID